MLPFSNLFSSRDTSIAHAGGVRSPLERIPAIRKGMIRSLLMLEQRSDTEIDLIALLALRVVKAVSVVEPDREGRGHETQADADVSLDFIDSRADAQVHGSNTVPGRADV